MFKELRIPGLKPERLEVVSEIFKGDVCNSTDWLREKLFNTHVYCKIIFERVCGHHK